MCLIEEDLVIFVQDMLMVYILVMARKQIVMGLQNNR